MGILVKVMAIKAAELSVLCRGKHPQVFTQNCNHLQMYRKEHSRANPEPGNGYLKIQMKHLKGLPKTQKNLVVMIVLLPSPEAATYLPRNILTYYFQCFFTFCFNDALHSLLPCILVFPPLETFLIALQFLLRGKGWLSSMLVSVLTNQQSLEIPNNI